MTPWPESQCYKCHKERHKSQGESVTVSQGEYQERHRAVTPEPELSWQRKCPVSVQWLNSTC